MRAVLIAILMTAMAAMSASAGTGGSGRGHMQDACAENNQVAPGSCIQLPPGAAGQTSGMVVYVDTGRADAWPGVWQEDNDFSGLQKVQFYGSRLDIKDPADTLVLG